LLCQGERTVEVLGKETNMSTANVSRHLQILHSAHLVEAKKKGVFVIYRLADEEVYKLFLCIQQLAEKRLAELQNITRSYLKEVEDFEPLNEDKLLKGIERGSTILLDVRPLEEYCAGHIPGAISVPFKDLETCLSKLPKDRKVVAYCRGPYCLLAIQAVLMLRAGGFNAIRLNDGVPGWRVRGHRIVKEK